MAIIGGFDVHRAQITFDYLDTETGEVMTGQIRPATRLVLREWLGRFEAPEDVAFAVEGCTGWRFVVEELVRAGVEPHLAEPADTATQRGRKKRAKTDRADARLLRELLAQNRLPDSWILGIPFKRARSEPIDYLEYDEIEAVLNQIDRSTPEGRRDYALMALMFNSGARVQEIVDLRAQDLQLARPFQVRLRGKGQKVRICPLWPQTAQLLRAFCTERELDLDSGALLFLNQWGRPLTRFGVRYILAKHCQCAQAAVPTLARKRLHPHSMRHSTAVHLMKAGVDLATISHWLGHASINTTNKYATIDLEMKREAIARVQPPGNGLHTPASWRSDASVLVWLESL